MIIIYLSDGYKGGNSTFLEQNIDYNIKNQNQVILIDKNPQKNFPELKNKKNLKLVKLDIFKQKIKVKRYIRKLKKKNHFFFFTNFKTYLIYYFYFNSYKKENIRIAMALHSGVFSLSLKLFIGLFLFSIVSLKLDYLIFGSYSSKKWWLNKFPWMNLINNQVIFNGVKKQKQKKKIKENFKISFIGRLEHENDPELFLKIYSLNKNKKKMIFNVFGDGSLKEKFKDKYRNVKFWGWSKKKQIYMNTDISIITSPLNNFPYVAMESNSYGIPVLTAARGDIRKIVKNNFSGYILKERTVENFNFFLKKTIKNYKKLSINSFENAKKFEVDESCRQIWRFLKIDNHNIR